DGQLRRHLLAVGQLFRHAPDDRLRGARLRPAQARGADRTGDPWHPSGECDGGRAAPRDGDFGRRLDLPLLDTDRARALALRGRRLPRADVPAPAGETAADPAQRHAAGPRLRQPRCRPAFWYRPGLLASASAARPSRAGGPCAQTPVLVPSGVLGLGFDRKALARGVALRPDIIAIDGGSTDSGPYSLGAGQSKYSRAATKAEWRELMLARAEVGVPLVIGTAGTCGADATVDWMFDITCELAGELGQNLRVARLYSGQPAERVIAALRAGRLLPLTPAPEITESGLSDLTNIVALAGAEQVQS